MTDIVNSIVYVVSVPYFWLTMGMVTSVSMFFGALIFDGDRSAAGKSLISTLVYTFFLFFVQVTRIIKAVGVENIRNPSQAYASTVTLLFVTAFWVLGVMLGVFANKFAKHNCCPKTFINSIKK